MVAPPFHGGRLYEAAKRYGVPESQWLDLSTGISPWPWPVPDIPDQIWHRLPELAPLISAAKSYYGSEQARVLPLAGSQIAIRHIPQLVAKSRVAIPMLGYQEHRYSWQLAGHRIVEYQSWQQLVDLVESKTVQHVVLINPNNPTTEWIPASEVLSLCDKLDENALFLIDEAFIDLLPASSVLNQTLPPNLIVLRSIGKFFGLAGIRLGFALGHHPLLENLSLLIEPWQVNGPAAFIGRLALLDTSWQQHQRERIGKAAKRLKQDIQQLLPDSTVSEAGLFTTVIGRPEVLRSCYELAAKAGVLLRFQQVDARSAWLRIGLSSSGYQPLFKVLS